MSEGVVIVPDASGQVQALHPVEARQGFHLRQGAPMRILVSAFLAAAVTAMAWGANTVELLRRADAPDMDGLVALGLLVSTSGLPADGRCEVMRRRLRSAVQRADPGGPGATSPSTACWAWAVLGETSPVRTALRDRPTDDPWVRAARVLCGDDPAIIGPVGQRSPAESAALLRSHIRSGRYRDARLVADDDPALPAHLRHWQPERLAGLDLEPLVLMAAEDAVAWLANHRSLPEVAAAAAGIRRPGGHDPSGLRYRALTTIAALERVIDADCADPVRDGAAFLRQRLIQSLVHARYAGQGLLDLSRPLGGQFAAWSLVGGLQVSKHEMDHMRIGGASFRTEHRPDGRGMQRAGVVLTACFASPEGLVPKHRHLLEPIIAAVLAEPSPDPDDLRILRAYDRDLDLPMSGRLAMASARYEIPTAPAWPDALRALRTMLPLPEQPAGAPAATRSLARIDIVATGWPGAGTGAAIVGWRLDFGQRSQLLRLRWESDAPGRIRHPGGEIPVRPGAGPAQVQVDLPAGGAATVEILSAIGRSRTGMRLTWQIPGDKGWRAGDDGMPGGGPWTESVWPVADHPNWRIIVDAAATRPWDALAGESAVQAAADSGRLDEAVARAARWVEEGDPHPDRVARIAAVIGAWRGSEPLLRDQDASAADAMRGYLRAGRLDDALNAARVIAFKPYDAVQKDSREALFAGIEAAMANDQTDAVMAWLPDHARSAEQNWGRHHIADMRQMISVLGLRSGRSGTPAVVAWLRASASDGENAQAILPMVQTGLRWTGDRTILRELVAVDRPMMVDWVSILARIRALVDAGRLDDAGKTLRFVEASFTEQMDEDPHGLLLVQALRRWRDQDPRKPHPERRRLDGLALTPAERLVLAAIDGNRDLVETTAIIEREGHATLALPLAIVAWEAGRIDLARRLLAMPQDTTRDPGIGARNLGLWLPAPIAAGAEGF
jgi:hypothetical protein